MCTRFVYNGIDKIVGFNFDIDLSVWDHTVITEENRFYIGIKMPDGMYHSFHGINKNGNVGTLLYVHGNENARYIESLTIKSQVWKWNILNELQKCISDIFVYWKLHDKKSVVTGTQLGDVYRKELSNEVVWLFWFLHCVNGSD